MLELVNICKSYQIRKDKVQNVLKNINVKFSNTGFVSILGSSGNGKTTLLNLIGGLDDFDSGKVLFNQKEVKDFEKFRREKVGYVFQQFNLIEHLNALDNVIVSMGDHAKNKKETAKKILVDMGLGECLNKLPKHLSGGQIQRIAIARMIAKDIDIIICDEPTGSLDEETEKAVVKIIKELSKTKLVIFVTHNRKVAKEYSDRIITVNSGELIEVENHLDDISINSEAKSRSYKKNTTWLSTKSLLGRLKYTMKYLMLTSFILLVTSLAFILEGEFFKQYMHMESLDSGIKIINFELVDEDSLVDDELIDKINKIKDVEHATPYYDFAIDLAATNYEKSRVSSKTLVENISGNDYIKTTIAVGRFPEKADEVLMTAKGVISLLKELKIGGQRLEDQYLTEEVSIEHVFSLIDWKKIIVAEYGMPRIKVVGLIDDKKIFEEYQKVYVLDGFFDSFEYPGGVKSRGVKVYKSDLYVEANDEIIKEVTEDESIIVNKNYSESINDLYSHINSYLQLSKATLYMIIAIATVSFLSLLYTSLFERKYEVGLYRALGYSKTNIIKTLATEMFMISLCSLFIVIVLLNVFTYVTFINLDYYHSFAEVLDTLNILGVIGSLTLVISVFIMVIVYTGNHIILRKTVLSNINDL